MYTLYVLIIFISILIAYAGVEETLRIFAYADLQLRYVYVRLQMKWMGWRLKKQLIRDTTNFEKFLKEYENK